MECHTHYLFTILVMAKWTKVVVVVVMMKLSIFQGSLMTFFAHQKADHIIYIFKHHTPPTPTPHLCEDLLVALTCIYL